MCGDAQIAERILARDWHRVPFTEDPHVARQHEADIQLLERAARTVSDYAFCGSDVEAMGRCLELLARRRVPSVVHHAPIERLLRPGLSKACLRVR